MSEEEYNKVLKTKVVDPDTVEEENFFKEVQKQFGIDKNCLTNVGKIYPLTVATNMLITLIATLFIVNVANYVNLMEYKYTTAELFLTTIVLFTLWNCLLGFSFGGDTYYVSTNTSLLVATIILPFIALGPKNFISQFC